jgi:hypothetical protein
MDVYPNHICFLKQISSVYSTAMLSELTSEKNGQSSASFVENEGLLNFPHKLWKIINECDTDAIHWNNEGRSILLDHVKFREQYLDSKNSLFRTKKMTSFLTQLSVYGFHTVKSYNKNLDCNLRNPNVREYVNDKFQRGREDLLSNVCRKNTTSAKIRFQGKQIKMEMLKEQTSGKRKAGPWLMACRVVHLFAYVPVCFRRCNLFLNVVVFCLAGT